MSIHKGVGNDVLPTSNDSHHRFVVQAADFHQELFDVSAAIRQYRYALCKILE